jgi:hypothetical protein
MGSRLSSRRGLRRLATSSYQRARAANRLEVYRPAASPVYREFDIESGVPRGSPVRSPRHERIAS